MRKYELHGMNGSKEYGIWESMIQRCFNKNNTNFKNYGGRGITVCDEWKNSFLSFYRDMGPRPSKDYSIDRIDNEKGYYKENCRWATKSEQLRNKRLHKKNKSGQPGVTWNKKSQKWQSQIKTNGKLTYLGLFSDLDKAIKERKKAELKQWYQK